MSWPFTVLSLLVAVVVASLTWPTLAQRSAERVSSEPADACHGPTDGRAAYARGATVVALPDGRTFVCEARP